MDVTAKSVGEKALSTIEAFGEADNPSGWQSATSAAVDVDASKIDQMALSRSRSM
jgi:hypothetical protein